mgnify:CR=1 FL=1
MESIQRRGHIGSPPRVREKLFAKGCRGLILRITPASAGKTGQKAHWNWIYKDHPRECGKNQLTGEWLPEEPGSPPRVREKHNSSKVRWRATRITPASAGKTATVVPNILT